MLTTSVPEQRNNSRTHRDEGPKLPARKRSRERYAKRRADVVDAAARVFAERGFHGTTIEDLVEATGLQRGGLYHYMDGKLDLLIAIHERFIEPLLESAREVAALDEPADVQLRALAHALMSDIAEYHNEVTVFLHEWKVIVSEPAWEDIRKARQEFEQIVTDVLERGVEEGKFAFSDSNLTMLGFLGMINYTYQWFDPDGPFTPETIADHFTDIFLRGILTPTNGGER